MTGLRLFLFLVLGRAGQYSIRASSMRRLLMISAVWAIAGGASLSHAQSLGYESFAGMPVGAGVAGSGSNSTGWVDAGWSTADGPRFQIADSTPNLTYQIPGGGLVE